MTILMRVNINVILFSSVLTSRIQKEAKIIKIHAILMYFNIS